MDPSELTKSLERLRNHEDFHLVIGELRRMRDEEIRALAEAHVPDSDMRQRLGFITAYDSVADFLQG